MLHQTLRDLYVVERSRFKRMLTLCFTMAGLYWFVIYAIVGFGLTPDPAANALTLRAGQTVIYLILMTLWGVDYLREERRLKIVIETANGRDVRPDAVLADDIDGKRLGAFSVLRPKGTGKAPFIMPLVNLAGLAGAAWLIIMQYVNAIRMIAS